MSHDIISIQYGLEISINCIGLDCACMIKCMPYYYYYINSLIFNSSLMKQLWYQLIHSKKGDGSNSVVLNTRNRSTGIEELQTIALFYNTSYIMHTYIHTCIRT